MKPVNFDVAAHAEVDEAAAWYANRDPQLPSRLLLDARETANLVQERPALFPRVTGLRSRAPLRRAPLRTFPYALIYVELDEELRLLAFPT